MICPSCKFEIPSEGEVCGHCRHKLGGNSKFETFLLFGIVFPMVGYISCVSGTNKDSSQTPQMTFEKTEGRLSEGTLCAIEQSDFARLIQAGKRSDMAAVTAMLSTGKAWRLSEGTLVDVGMQQGGMALGRIQSGAHIGKSCWLNQRFIKER
jgi:hypothetical protein